MPNLFLSRFEALGLEFCRNFLLVAVDGIIRFIIKIAFVGVLVKNTFLACFMGPSSFVNYRICGE